MTYLTINDLRTYMFSVFITESENDFVGVADELELNAIALVKSKLAIRYDVNAIFLQPEIARHRLIVKILAILVLYDLVRRNSARKIPDDFRLDWEWAIKYLNDLRDGKEVSTDLPVLDASNQNNLSNVYYGNNSNENFYL
jgi:hypothetical protein